MSYRDKLINLDYIMQFKPCKSGVKEYIEAGYREFEGNIFEFLSLDKISASNRLWVVLREEIIPEKDLHELACRFAESVLHIFEKEYPDDKKPRQAIEAKRKYIKGELTNEELTAARAAAWDAARAAMYAAMYAARGARGARGARAARAAMYAAMDAAMDAARDAARGARGARAARAAMYAAMDAAMAAARDAARGAWAAATDARAAEQQKQINIIIEYLGNKNELSRYNN